MTHSKNGRNSSQTLRVMIVDDHPALCEGLGHRIASQTDMEVCAEASDVDEALEKIREHEPNVVIVDIALKNSDGLELLKEIKARHKEVRPVVHSMYEEALYADRCLQAGAMGYVNKEAHPDCVIEAIRQVSSGTVYLSPEMTREILGRTVSGTPRTTDPIDTLTDRQLEIFRLIGDGLRVQQIADRLYISEHTVETHRENIKRKLGVESSQELTRRAVLWTANNH